MKIYQIFIFFLFISISLGFENNVIAQKKIKKTTILKNRKVIKKQMVNPQICGNIVKLSGNQMPDPDQPIRSGTFFIGEILIYKLTKQADTEGDGATQFTKINTKLVKKINSDKTGNFCVNLPIGKYSVFVNDPSFGLFASVFDGEMNINPIEVIQGKNPNFNIKINHSASF